MSYRTLGPEDLPRVLELNNTATPAVGRLTLPDLERLVAMASVRVVAVADDAVVGFALGLPPGQAYSSENYRYFADRYDDFHYLDRIVVDPTYYRRGLGSGLYDEVERLCGAPALLCEVNIRPLNGDSLAFHEHRGFHRVDTQDTEGGTKTVALLRKDLPHPPASS